jgi:hypothetical protein
MQRATFTKKESKNDLAIQTFCYRVGKKRNSGESRQSLSAGFGEIIAGLNRNHQYCVDRKENRAAPEGGFKVRQPSHPSLQPQA